MQRIGRKNEAQFRIVLTDHKNAAKSGRFQEILGSYNPKLGVVTFEEARVKYWMSVGAQPSDTVFNFLVTKGIITGKKINVLSRKAPTKKRKELKAA
jgi:small subunit ribosomal protein S16